MNIELMRKILLELRAGGRPFAVTGYREEEVHRVAGKLRRDKYILGVTAWRPGQPYEYVMPRRLTERGKELAAALESDLVWTYVKRVLPRPEDRSSIAVIQAVAQHVNCMRNLSLRALSLTQSLLCNRIGR